MASAIVKTLSRQLRSNIRLLTNTPAVNFSNTAPACSSIISELNICLDPNTKHYDPSRTFLKKDVQRLLYRMTGLDSQRLTERSNMTQMLELPIHRFLTVEEFEIERTRGFLRARKKLKIPPVMAPRKPGGDVISQNSQLDKLLEHKMIFTDITYGLKDRDRVVVVRETDGTLRDSTWDEKMRMCQTFFPRLGRETFLPRMFKPEFLSHALSHVSATYLLESACAQLEPDDPDYIRVVHAVYDDVDQKGTYDELYSTRFFGGLVFYLTCVARLDGLMLNRLIKGTLADAADVVKLLNILHPKCSCALAAGRSSEPLSDQRMVELYLETMATGAIVTKLRGALGAVVKENERENESDCAAVNQ